MLKQSREQKYLAAMASFGYVLKTHPTLMNPTWAFRAKDEADLSLLEEILRQKGVDVALLSVQVTDNICTC